MMKVPTFQEPGLSRFLEDMSKEVQQFRIDTVAANKANHSLLLISPSKKVYEIKVDDAGAISATLVRG
jgi:hypothetical protein